MGQSALQPLRRTRQPLQLRRMVKCVWDAGKVKRECRKVKEIETLTVKENRGGGVRDLSFKERHCRGFVIEIGTEHWMPQLFPTKRLFCKSGFQGLFPWRHWITCFL